MLDLTVAYMVAAEGVILAVSVTIAYVDARTAPGLVAFHFSNASKTKNRPRHLLLIRPPLRSLASKGDTIGIAATRGGHRETLEVCLETGVPFVAKNNKGRCVCPRVDHDVLRTFEV